MAVMEAVINHVLYDLDMRPIVSYNLPINNEAKIFMTNEVLHNLRSRTLHFREIVVYVFYIKRAIIVKLVKTGIKRYIRDKTFVVVGLYPTKEMREKYGKFDTIFIGSQLVEVFRFKEIVRFGRIDLLPT